MGVWSTIKGWLNIGGVKVTMSVPDQRLIVGPGTLEGTATLTAKETKEVLKVLVQIVHSKTRKKDGEEQTETFVLGEQELSSAFTLEGGQSKEFPFAVGYHVDEQVKHMGGMLGMAGKMASLASGGKDEFSVTVSTDVKGTVLDPSATVSLKVAPKK